MSPSNRASTLLGGFLLALTAAATAYGCSIALPPFAGPVKFINIEEEKVLIAWDPATRIEHFVRAMRFGPSARDFGFIVPVPSVPDIAPADGGVFDVLARKASPLEATLPPLDSLLFRSFAFLRNMRYMFSGAESAISTIGGETRGVTLLRSTRVFDDDVSVLQADDSKALNAWLKAHGYQSRPALEEWFKPYVEKHWTFVAFKFDPKGRPAETLGIPAVRLTFRTDRPFFPYREPADQRSYASHSIVPRILRVFYVGPKRTSGALEDERTPWPGVETYANMSFSTPVLLKGAIPVDGARKFSWITVFEDRSSPRPADSDLYFSDRDSIIPDLPSPKITWSETYYVPVELLGFILIVLFIRPGRRHRK